MSTFTPVSSQESSTKNMGVSYPPVVANPTVQTILSQDQTPPTTQIQSRVIVHPKFNEAYLAASKAFQESFSKNPYRISNSEFLEQVKAAITNRQSLKFADDVQLDAANLPIPSRSLIELAIGEFNVEAIKLFFRLNPKHMQNLAEIIVKNITKDARAKNLERLNKYVQFVLTIISQNQIRPSFLHEYYIKMDAEDYFDVDSCDFDECYFPTQHHLFLLTTLRDTFDLKTEALLSRFSIDELNYILDDLEEVDEKSEGECNWLKAVINISQEEVEAVIQKKQAALPKNESKSCVIQ